MTRKIVVVIGGNLILLVGCLALAAGLMWLVDQFHGIWQWVVGIPGLCVVLILMFWMDYGVNHVMDRLLPPEDRSKFYRK